LNFVSGPPEGCWTWKLTVVGTPGLTVPAGWNAASAKLLAAAILGP
jgi:hypothetical protein